MRRQGAMRTCHHHVPPPRRGRLPARSAVYSSSPLCLPTERTGNQARTARAPAIEQGNSGNGGNGGGRGELTAIYKKKAPSPLRFEEAAASRKSRRPVQPLKSPLPFKRRQPFLLPLLLELLLRSIMLIIMMI